MDNDNVTSLGAARAAKSDNAADWSPRDALEDMLKRMDAGEVEPEGLIICFYVSDDKGGSKVYYSSAMPNVIMAAGTLDRASHSLSPPAEAF